MRGRKQFWKGALCGALLTCIVGIGLLYTFMGVDDILNRETEQKLRIMRQLIDSKYLYGDAISDENLQEALMKGYVNGLGDPYSVYYDKEETQALMESTSGEFVGIGVVLSKEMETNTYTFTTIYEDSPAQKAGAKEGDVLYAVDGEPVAKLDMDSIVLRIKGEKGTKVLLTVLRDGKEKTLEAVRDKVVVKTVSYEMKPNQIGYLYVSGFEEVTYQQFENAITALKKQGMKALVIDLRNNPGGNFDTVCDMLDYILPEGVIISTKDKNGKGQVVKSDAEHALKLPLAVLVNGNSASASEVFSGAVQDYGIGTIIGTTTYGKGIVQELYQLPDGTCLKITTSEYYTPNGRSIHGVGIQPDIEVEYVYDETNPERDNQLQKALEVLANEI